MGLSVQGGTGTTRHVDGMLEALREPGGQRPRLVHRLDKDTAGCLLVARTRFAAAALAKVFRSREARKIYCALVAGVLEAAARRGTNSTFLAKEEGEDDLHHADRPSRRGGGASHAVTGYAGRRDLGAAAGVGVAQAPSPGAPINCAPTLPISNIRHRRGGPKIFQQGKLRSPAGGIQNRRCICMARRIAVPHRRGGIIDVTAPLLPHMRQSFQPARPRPHARYDPITDAPEE